MIRGDGQTKKGRVIPSIAKWSADPDLPVPFSEMFGVIG
jgi:hypothetical protein